VDLSTKHPRILRPGIITPSDLQPYLSEEINYIHANGQEPIQSPGMKYRHYKPNLQIIVFSEVEKITKLIQDENAKKPFIIFTQADCKSDFTSLTFLDLNELACELYHLFFTMEKERYDLLLIQRIDAVGIGETLMNRILKAADRMD
jgi:L-threonylcarbamoyladenylate synthase